MIIERGNIISESQPVKEASSHDDTSSYREQVDDSEINLKRTCLTGFDNPVEFLAFFDDSVKMGKENGGIDLYPWQVEIGELFGTVNPTGLNPFKFCLCAANGSGKDKYITAPFAVWFICCKVNASVIITSSSGKQLTNQTEKYISLLVDKVNKFAIETMGGKPIIKIRQRRITCLISGSEIFLFATDEPGQAEGYHPFEPNAEMAIVVNEAKSVPPDIFAALRRCTGYNYWLNISTPGEPLGDFYKSWKNWPNKKRVTFFDCPDHQSKTEFEEERKVVGEADPNFRSKWLALFTYVGGKNVINQAALERLQDKIELKEVKEIFPNKRLIGLDIALSDYGDETILSDFKGNVQKHLIHLRIKDATKLANKIDYELTYTLKVKKDQAINADDGGVGRAVIDILRMMGWTNINRILNQSAAKNKKQFRNRGAEIWFKFAKLIEHGLVILLNDPRQYEQILSRKYKSSIAGIDKMTLQSKTEMIAEGLPSPDRADASVLAFATENINAWIDAMENAGAIKVSQEVNTINEETNLRQVLKDMENANRTNYRGPRNGGKRLHGSLNALLHRDKGNSRMLKWS
jgi:phage terminase large subunit